MLHSGSTCWNLPLFEETCRSTDEVEEADTKNLKHIAIQVSTITNSPAIQAAAASNPGFPQVADSPYLHRWIRSQALCGDT